MTKVFVVYFCPVCDAKWVGERPDGVTTYHCLRCDLIFSSGVVGEGAERATMRCPQCGHLSGRSGHKGCPNCGGSNLELTEGRECPICALMIAGEGGSFQTHLESHMGMEYG